MKRRRLLEGLALSSLSILFPCVSHANLCNASGKLKMFSNSINLMGTDLNIIIYHRFQDYAYKIMDDMFNLAISLVSVFSRHNSHSALSFLNDNGYIKDPPHELRYVLKKSLYFYKITRGAFDIRVNSIIRCLEENSALEEINSKFKKFHSQKDEIIIFKGKNIYLSPRVESINLDAISKGFIVDKMVEFAREKGINHCLVNAGGDIRAAGGLPNGKKWEISLYNPIKKDTLRDKIYIKDGGIATSGIYFKEYQHGFSHIIDTRNLNSPKHHISVTVISGDATISDALATACTVLDTDKSFSIISQFGNKGIIIRENGEIITNFI